MPSRIIVALVILAAAAGTSAAQVPVPRGMTGPTAWTSLSVGLYQLQAMYDPGSGSVWDFGNIVQFRGTLERDVQRGMSAGAAVTYTRAPLTYDGPECVCDADVPVWQALALLRLGAGGSAIGLHQVIELGAGVTGFGAFQRRDGGRLAPETTLNPTFSIGYGLGYSFSPNTQFTLVQEVGLMVHRRGDRPAGDESNMPRTYATRIGLRYGLGGRR
jgi:hypothetical protein